MCEVALLAFCVLVAQAASAQPNAPGQWRTEKRLIDMHTHVSASPEHLARAVKILDGAGIGVAVNLGVGTVTPGKDGAPSQLEQAKKLADQHAPGRFLQYMTLDYAGFDDPGFAERAAKQIETGHRQGAAGLKEFKRLGLFLRDGKGKLIKVDDPKLDPAWAKCGELGMPVSIHVGDPKAFWDPYNDKNERWRELKSHRNWWFGDPDRYPPRMEIVEALGRVIARHPKTTFVCVHFGNNPEDVDWVDAALEKHPNMMIDLAARIPEIGRHDPDKVHRFFVKHQDRIVLGTDFQVYDRLTLGSGGDGPPPTDEDAAVFFQKHWRYLETRDPDWEHMTPIQGDWKISSIGLPPQVLRKVYFDNARRLLARSLPPPVIRAARSDREVDIDGNAAKPLWKKAPPTRIEYSLKDVVPRPELSTEVRCLYTDKAIYFLFTCPYTKLTTFTDKPKGERLGLWDRDVVEVFLAPDVQNVRRYGEYEVAPTNERLDVLISPENKDFAWDSHFTSAVKVDEKAKVWMAELRIPYASLGGDLRPLKGRTWRLNLYRSDRAGNVFMAWNPTLTGTAHTPERFGIVEFGD